MTGRGEEIDTPPARRADDAFLMAGLLVVLASAWVPWAVSRVGESDAAPRLMDLPMTRWAFVACGIGISIRLVGEWRGGRSKVSDALSVVCATILCVVPVLGMALIELVTMWMSPDLLPATLRRLAFGLKPMPGIWLAAIGGALCLVGATERGHGARRLLVSLRRGLAQRNPAALMFVALAVAVGVLAGARYGAWVHVNSTWESWNVPGWAMPWIGLLSLAALLAASAIGVLAAIRPSVGLGVALSTIGWSIAFMAGLTILVSASTPSFDAPGWAEEWLARLSDRTSDYAMSSPVELPRIPTDLEVDVSVGTGAVLAFLSGLIIMACALTVCRHAGEGSGR